MLAILLAFSLGQRGPAPLAPRDVAVIDPTDAEPTAPRPAVAALSDVELERRIAALTRGNKRAFSDRRALLLQELKAERERRRQERDWEEENRKREAEQAAASARLEAQYLADQKRQREADEAARSAIAAARTAADEEAREAARAEADLRAAERRQTLLRWGAVGALGLAAAAVVLAIRKRR